MRLSTASDLVSKLNSARPIEAWKWVGMVAMLIEHVAHFGVGMEQGWPFVIGRLAFPLFTVALAYGLAEKSVPELLRAAGRLALWGCAAGIVGLAVRDFAPLNVLFTFALGVLVHWSIRHYHRGAVFVFLGASCASLLVEYGFFGVMAVACALHGARQRTAWSQLGWLVFAVLLISMVRFNELAVLSIPVLLLLDAVKVEIPRVRRMFYWVYVGQWPLIAAVRVLM